MTKRKPITDGMRYRALKLHGAVLVRCFGCVRHRDRMESRGIQFDGNGAAFPDTTWHTLDAVQFDHVHELADKGKHGAKHLQPLCIPCHKEKTAKNETLRHHLDRAGKKHRGEWQPKHPMPSTGRKLQSRPFQENKTPIPWGKR